ncbi:phage late control D family protein [Streptomyces sp. NPDC005931]|uniref:phage late control D family protein n=1 Tax=Streptomyces sp. NPDC005931 TaxID=3364737 RepID=UPI0036874DCD
MSAAPGYAPELRLMLAGRPAPAALRGSVTSVSATCGFGDADRLEVALANEALRWLDHDLLRLDTPAELWLGYAPEEPARVFAGEIVGGQAAFPGTGMPTLTVVAQDRRTRLAAAAPSRWFGVPVPHLGVMPLPDVAVAPALALEHGLLPVVDPLGALLAAALGAVEAMASIDDPTLRQRIVREQAGATSLDFLKQIAAENAWEIVIDHAAAPAGLILSLMSPAAHLSSDVTLRYGHSLIDFTPRLSTVGQVASVSARVWQPSIRLELTVTVGYDWDRQALDLSVTPGFGLPTDGAPARQVLLLDEPVSPANAARTVLGKLLPRLNRRLTASGTCPGDARIRAGYVLRIEGVGETFGGLWRVTSVTQTVDAGGWCTSFEARKEIWFGSIPAPAQGAVRVQGGLLSMPAAGG